MIWLSYKSRQIQPIHSLRRNNSHRRHTAIQQDLYQRETHGKMIGSIISLMAFFLLSIATIIVASIILTRDKHETICSTTTQQTDVTTPIESSTDDVYILERPERLCAENATWNSTGVTVAGLASGLPSSSLAGLNSPHDIYVFKNGTVLVADTNNNRVMKWDQNATVGVLIAGTGSYGSWINLLAKPISIAIRGEQMYVSDLENYRIQVFPLHTNLSSPDARTLIGRYGRGSALNQLSFVGSIIAPRRFPSLLYFSDWENHRVLLCDLRTNTNTVVAERSDSSGSNFTDLFNPYGMALNERTNALYIADRSNNRIQKYDMDGIYPPTTVAGWGQLNGPSGVQLDPPGLNMFIADTYNHRILLWLKGAGQGRVIAGNGMAGNSVNQLHFPMQVQLDGKHNLYVADSVNCRIQRFDLISNGC